MSRMKSVMKHDFSRSPQANIPRSSFNRSHGHKTTLNAGLLYPVFVDEILPGDTFSMKMQLFARLATPIFPIMDNLFMDTFFFFVPMRLVWENWERFNGAQDAPGDSTNFEIPTLTSGSSASFATSSIFDYMGIPTLVNNITVNALPFRCYNLIWNDWFRDENFQDSRNVPLDDGPDPVSDYAVQYRGKRYDYFTSCLPFPQKGPTVDIPIGTSAPVSSDGNPIQLGYTPNGNQPGHMKVFGSPSVNYTLNYSSGVIPPFDQDIYLGFNGSLQSSGLTADLSEATAATINQLRQAFQIQRMYERDARGGTRYTEIIRSHFGVISPDMRLQRPEYLGGGSYPVNIHPIPQTSGTSITGESTPQGNLAAFGTVSALSGWTKSFVEHGYIIGLVAVRADYTYQQGCERMWFRSTRFDFYWPALSHLGEQAVLNQEIYTQGTSADTNVFGYQEVYAEYRYKPSRISGLFRSNASGTLDAWHLSQDFGSLPVLGVTFIQENPPMARIKAVTDQPDFIVDTYFDLKCARPMPMYGVPGLIDHF